MISFEYVANQIWAIKEENLKIILEITSRTNPSLDVIEAKLGQKLVNTRETIDEESTRVIQVRGPIVRYGNMFTEVSGATSLTQIQSDFKAALEDEKVKSILFDIDSPGGEASGIEEFAEQIYQARGKKPMVSYVGNMACSAAYWIASATDKIVVGKTASTGSIGCVAVIRDTEERDAKEGIKNIKFISSNSPNKRPDVTTDEGKSLIQEQIDAIGDIFIETMARNRSKEGLELTFKDVVTNFNKGGVLIGKEAVKAGLADELGSFESTLQNLTSGEQSVLANEKETSMKLENDMEKIEEGKNPSEATTLEVTSGGAIGKFVPTVSLEDFEALKASNEELMKSLESFEAMKASMEALKASAAQIAEEKLQLEAKTKVAEFNDKMVPAQAEKAISSYIQASKDDKENPVEGFSRVESLVSVWAEMPKHNKTEELLADEDLIVVKNDTEEQDEAKQLKEDASNQVEAYLRTLKTGTSK